MSTKTDELSYELENIHNRYTDFGKFESLTRLAFTGVSTLIEIACQLTRIADVLESQEDRNQFSAELEDSVKLYYLRKEL